MKNLKNKYQHNLQNLKHFLGEKSFSLMISSFFLSGAYFIMEVLFVFLLQYFLFSLSLIQFQPSLGSLTLPQNANLATALLAVYAVFRAIIMGAKTYSTNMSGQFFINHQRKKIAEFILKYPLKIPSNEINEIFSERISNASYCIEQINSFILSLLITLMLMIYSFNLAPVQTLFGLALLGFIFLPIKRMSQKIKTFGDGVANEWKFINEKLHKGIQNGKLLKIYNLNYQWFKNIDDDLKKYLEHYKKYYKDAAFISNIPPTVGLLILLLITSLTLNVSPLEKTTLLSFFYIFVRLGQQSGMTASSWSVVKMSWGGVQRISQLNDFMNSQNESSLFNKQKDISNPNIESEISLEARNLTFSYPHSKQNIFENFNFTIQKSDFLVIKGASGTGKSTLLNLLMNQLNPTAGGVYLNNTPIQQCSATLANVIGYVGPYSYFQAGTIREYLNVGLDESQSKTDNFIFLALKNAQILKTVQGLPLGLDTYLSENTELSTGQLQRLALARALLRDPSILILDEATANLDFKTENEFIQELKNSFHNKILIAITHRSGFDIFSTQLIQL